jgi:soluble P-type ATPase
MIRIEIPGIGLCQIEHLVLDYNGTLAIDGNILNGVQEKLNLLASKLCWHWACY